MAVRDVEFVIIGGGVAAAKAAEGVRAAGGEGTAVVLTAEPELPYERPPLSKEFLRGEAGREQDPHPRRGLVPRPRRRGAAGHQGQHPGPGDPHGHHRGRRPAPLPRRPGAGHRRPAGPPAAARRGPGGRLLPAHRRRRRAAAGGHLQGREHGDHRRRLHRGRGGGQRHPDGHPGDHPGDGRDPVDQGGRPRDGRLLRGLPARPGGARPHPDQGRAAGGRRHASGRWCCPTAPGCTPTWW